MRREYDDSLRRTPSSVYNNEDFQGTTVVNDPRDFFAQFRSQFFQDDDDMFSSDPFGGFFRREQQPLTSSSQFDRMSMFDRRHNTPSFFESSFSARDVPRGGRSVSTRVVHTNGRKITTVTTINEDGSKTVQETVENM